MFQRDETLHDTHMYFASWMRIPLKVILKDVIYKEKY